MYWDTARDLCARAEATEIAHADCCSSRVKMQLKGKSGYETLPQNNP